MSQYAPPTQMPSDFDPSRRPSIGLAVAALACSIGGLCIPGAGIVGIILGVVALTNAGRTPQTHGGRGLAVAGIVVGVLSILWILVFAGMVILLPALGSARQSARQAVSQVQMQQINIALSTYAAANGGAMPEAGANLPARLAPMGITANLFISPAAENPGASDSYIYVGGHNVNTLREPARAVVLYENPKYFTRGRIAVIFADGHSERVSPDDLEALLDAMDGARTPKDLSEH